MAGLASLYYILKDFEDRNRAEQTRTQQGNAANWLENFSKAATPEERDLRMSQLKNVVSDPVIRQQARASADTELLKNFTTDAAPLYGPSKIPGQTGQLPTQREARSDLMAFAQDQGVNPLIALQADKTLSPFAVTSTTPDIKTFGTEDIMYRDGEEVKRTPHATGKTDAYVPGKRYDYVGQGGHKYQGTFQGLDPQTKEPQWTSSIKIADKDSDGSSASNNRLLRSEGVKAMETRLFAEAVKQNPEVAQIDRLLGDVDSSIKYSRVRALMDPETQKLMDKVTQRAGELTFKYGGDFEKAANEALGEFQDEMKEQVKNHPKELTDDIAAAIFQEAGGDPAKATQIAEERGYKLQ